MQQYRSLKKNCKYDIAKAKKNNSKLLECEEEEKRIRECWLVGLITLVVIKVYIYIMGPAIIQIARKMLSKITI